MKDRLSASEKYCEMLREGDADSHWFTAPNSRLIVNVPGWKLRASNVGDISDFRLNVACFPLFRDTVG